MDYIVRRISPYSALFYGLLIGFVAWLIPGMLFGWFIGRLVSRLAAWINSLQFELPLPLGQSLTVDLIPLLQLGDRQNQLASLAARDTSLILASGLATAAAGMLLTGVTALIGALVYNLFAHFLGGVQIVLDPLDATVAPAKQTTASVEARPVKSTADQNTAPVAVKALASRPETPPATAATTTTAWLASATDSTQRWRLDKGTTRIGSDRNNDIVLPGLSPQHAEIRREDGRYIIYDLGTRQTWVNSNQVATAHLLKNGFRLQLGATEFTVHILVKASG